MFIQGGSCVEKHPYTISFKYFSKQYIFLDIRGSQVLEIYDFDFGQYVNSQMIFSWWREMWLIF